MSCLVLLAVAAPVFGDFATSSRPASRSARPIFGGGFSSPPSESAGTAYGGQPNQGAASSPGSYAADPFLHSDVNDEQQPIATPENRPTKAADDDATSAQGWIHPSIVRVRAEETDGIASGSGTLIGVDEEHGYVITNWHVVQGASGPVTVSFPDGFQSAATVMKMDSDWDLAILVIWKPNALPMPLSPRLPSRGEPLIIAGYGAGEFRSAQGVMTEFVAPDSDLPYEMFEVSTAARHGDSGGPIVNMQGQLAGVLFGAGEGRTTGSHVGRLKQFLNEAFQVPDSRASDALPLPPLPMQTQDTSVAASQPRVAAQQPAAIHESHMEAEEMDRLAREVAASLPASPIYDASDVAVEIPGDRVASLPASALPVPQELASTSQGYNDAYREDLLAGIPLASPHEYRLPTAGYRDAGYRGGSAFGDLKTFLVMFGIFAVVFVLLPRNR